MSWDHSISRRIIRRSWREALKGIGPIQRETWKQRIWSWSQSPLSEQSSSTMRLRSRTSHWTKTDTLKTMGRQTMMKMKRTPLMINWTCTIRSMGLWVGMVADRLRGHHLSGLTPSIWGVRRNTSWKASTNRKITSNSLRSSMMMGQKGTTRWVDRVQPSSPKCLRTGLSKSSTERWRISRSTWEGRGRVSWIHSRTRGCPMGSQSRRMREDRTTSITDSTTNCIEDKTYWWLFKILIITHKHLPTFNYRVLSSSDTPTSCSQ